MQHYSAEQQAASLSSATALHDMQIPLDRLLLETDAPDGKPRLDEPYKQRMHSVVSEGGNEEQNSLNHPANIRSADKLRLLICVMQSLSI